MIYVVFIVFAVIVIFIININLIIRLCTCYIRNY